MDKCVQDGGEINSARPRHDPSLSLETPSKVIGAK